MFRHRLRIALFALGTIAGFGSGFASMRHCRYQRHDSFERHVAKICADAARDNRESRDDREAPREK